MHFHGVSLGNQHEMWSKPHNGKVRILIDLAVQRHYEQAEERLLACLDTTAAQHVECIACIARSSLIHTAVSFASFFSPHPVESM